MSNTGVNLSPAASRKQPPEVVMRAYDQLPFWARFLVAYAGLDLNPERILRDIELGRLTRDRLDAICRAQSARIHREAFPDLTT